MQDLEVATLARDSKHFEMTQVGLGEYVIFDQQRAAYHTLTLPRSQFGKCAMESEA